LVFSLLLAARTAGRLFRRFGRLGAAEEPPDREGRGEAAGDLVEVEARSPEISLERAVMSRAPVAEVVGVDGLHLEDQEDDVHGEEAERRQEETRDVLLPPGARGEREERPEEDEVEVKVARRQPRVRGAGRKVGALDEELLVRRFHARDGGALSEAQQEFRGGRQDPLVRGGEQEKER